MEKRLILGTLLAIFVLNTVAPIGFAQSLGSSLHTSDQDAPITGDPGVSSSGSTYVIGGVSFSGANVFNDFLNLQGLPGTVENYQKVIEEYFVPYNIRFSVIWLPGWWGQPGYGHANTTTTDITFKQEIDNLLTACDKYGISILFFWPQQWSHSGDGWIVDTAAQFPEMAAWHKNGSRFDPTIKVNRNPFQPDHPAYELQFKEDLKQLYEMYGHHPSWVGVGQFHGDDSHITMMGDVFTDVGLSGRSLQNYVYSKYFEQIVNLDTGTHKSDGTPCKLYETFTSSTGLFYGNWLQSVPFSGVYGGTEYPDPGAGHVLAFKFQAPENLEGFKIVWYGQVKGTPPNPLVLDLYRNVGPYDQGDFPANLGHPIEQQTASISGIGWQPAVSFNTRLAKGDYYWIVFHAEGGDSSNCYLPFYKDHKYDESTMRYSYKGFSTYPGHWTYHGSIILKIQDKGGNDKKIYPCQIRDYGSPEARRTQRFVPDRTIYVNTVFIQTSDRFYDETPATIKLMDVSTQQELASGTFSQATFKGFPGQAVAVPVPLDSRVKLYAGNEYEIVFESMPSGAGWAWYSLETDTPSEGFQGQSETYIFRLADLDIVSEASSFGYMHQGGSDAPEAVGTEASRTYGQYSIGSKDGKGMLAVRFIPTQPATLSKVSLYIWEKAGSPGDLVVSLYSGSDQEPTSPIETKTISSGSVPSSRAWLDISGWTSSLAASQYYWIVFSSPTATGGSEYRPARVTNPYYWMPKWSYDGGTTWFKGYDVMDLVAAIETTAERFAVEPEARYDNRLSDRNWLAQSFSVSTDTSVKGLMLDVFRGSDERGDDMVAEIRTDDNNQPSSTILTQGTLKYEYGNVHGLDLLDFDMPVTLTANTKYWIVLRTPRFFRDREWAPTTTVWSYTLRYPQYSYGGTSYGVKYTSNAGAAWSLVNNQETDIMFALLRAPASPSLAELVDTDLAPYHCVDFLDEPPRGWNTYLNIQVDRMSKNLMEWFEGYTGRRWITIHPNSYAFIKDVGGQKWAYQGIFITGPLPNQGPPTDQHIVNRAIVKAQAVLKQSNLGLIPVGSLGHSMDNTGAITAEQIGFDFRLTTPLCARGINVYDVQGSKLMDEDLQHWSRIYGEILSRMKYNGGYFGHEKGEIKALLIGDSDVGITPIFFTPAVDATLVGFSEGGDFNLTEYGDFSEYDVIAWISGRPDSTQISLDAQNRIKRFVSNGGGLVFLGGFADWANEVLGADNVGGWNKGSIVVEDPHHPILKPFTDLSGYRYDGTQVNPTTCHVIVGDSIGSVWISENDYGSGRGIFCGISGAGSIGKIGTWIDGATEWYNKDNLGAQRSSWWSLFTNALVYAAGKHDLLPIWHFDGDGVYKNEEPWHKQFWFTIDGKPGEVLLWISNNNETTDFEIHLNADFYGIDSAGWIAVDVASWNVVAKGSGTDIRIVTTIPAKSWKPIYIMNATSDLKAMYSNVFLIDQSTNTDEAAYVLQGPYNQTSWLLVTSTRQPISVSANNTGLLNEYSLEDLISSSALEGWYYDPTNKILYIKFHPTSPVQVEISLTVVPEFPTWMSFLATFAAVTALVVLAKRKLKRSFFWKKSKVCT